MKYILRSRLIILLCVVAVVLGFFVGHNLEPNFSDMYFRTFMLPMIRYILLAIIFTIHFVVFNLSQSSILTLRRKNLYNALFYEFKVEALITLLVFILMNIPIMFMNLPVLTSNIVQILEMIINGLLISILMFSIVRNVDIFIKNRAFVIGAFLSLLIIFDFLIEHFNWFNGSDPIFDFSYIFSLPYMYNYYYIFIIVFGVIIFFANSLYIFVGIKKDCLLRSTNYEEN